MKFKHSLVYTALFAIPAFANAEEAKLDEVQVKGYGISQNGYQATGTSIVSKAEVPIIDTPTTVNVLSTQLLEDRKPNDLIDALYNVSGVSQANTLGGMFDSIQKRGFGGNRDNSILRNGMQAGPAKNFGATTETVEVLKGPASVLYGIQDPGGVINVVTKKPQQTSKHVIGGTVGNHNALGTQFDSTGSLGNGFAYRFIFDKLSKDYWRNIGKVENTTYAPSLSWEDKDTKVLLAYEHKDISEPFDRGTYFLAKTGKLPNIPVERRLDEPNNQVTGKVDNIDVSVEQKLNEHWKLNAGYNFSRYEYFYNQARITDINTSNSAKTYVNKKTGKETAPDLAAGYARREIEQQRGDQRVHTGTINFVGEFGIGNVANRLVTGMDLMRNIRELGPIYNKGITASDINIYKPEYTNPVALAKNGNGNAYQYNHLKTLGVYLQDTAYWTDKFITTGGVRYEYYDQISGRHCLNAADCKQGQNVKRTYNTNQHDGDLTYQIGAVYKFTPSISTYVNYAESFRPQFAIADRVDSSLPPEEGKSYEVGTKFETDNFNAAVALFNIDKRHVAETVGTGSDAHLVIAGKQRSRGIELEFNGQIIDNLSLSTNYTYTNVKTLENREVRDSEGKQALGVPQHQASAFLAYELPAFNTGKIRLGTGARYLGSWNAYDSKYTKSYKIPHAVVYDAFANYTTKIANKNVIFQFNVKNLTNKTYFPSTSGNASSTLVPVALGYGREFLFNTKVEF